MSRSIVSLNVENVKRIVAVQVNPDGSPLVVIGGNNGAGKSSLLDSIIYALQGKGAIPSKPVRNGKLKAEIVIEISGEPHLIVTRKIKENGFSTVEVKQRIDGVDTKVASPQRLLDTLVGRISFDPLAFTRLKPRDQVEMLKDVVGVSTDEIDEREKMAFEQRTSVNRRVKELATQVNSLAVHRNAQPVDVAQLLRDLNAVEVHNKGIDVMERELQDQETRLQNKIRLRDEHFKAEVLRLENELERAKEELALVERDCTNLTKEIAEKQKDLGKATRQDDSELRQRIESADEMNQKVRENRQREEVAAQLRSAQDEADSLTKTIESAREQRLELMGSAKWPIPGLGFGDNGVTMNGLPFEQCSSAEQLKISTAIGLACNPELNVMMIRDGSLLDETSLKTVADLAADHGAQVWIERVGHGSECSVIIEDGSVKE